MPKINACPPFIQSYCHAAIAGDSAKLRELRASGLPFSINVAVNDAKGHRVRMQSAVLACLSENQIEAAKLLIQEGFFQQAGEDQRIIEKAWKKKQFNFLLWTLENPRTQNWLAKYPPQDVFSLLELIYFLDNNKAFQSFFIPLLVSWNISEEQRTGLSNLMSVLYPYKQYDLSFDDAKQCALKDDELLRFHAAIIGGDEPAFQSIYTDLAIEGLNILSNEKYHRRLFELACMNSHKELASTIEAMFLFSDTIFSPVLFKKIYDAAKVDMVGWFLERNPALCEDFDTTLGPDVSIICHRMVTEAKLKRLRNNLSVQPQETPPAANLKKRTNESAASQTQKQPKTRQTVATGVAKTMGIHSKYLGKDPIPRYIPIKANKPVIISDRWSFYIVPDLTPILLQQIVDPIHLLTEWFQIAFYSLSQTQVSPQDRTTFVFAGRGMNGKYPMETAGGRVILICTDSDYSPQLLAPNRDVCVIKNIYMMGMVDNQAQKTRVPEEDLGLIMTRRLAAFYLTKYFELDHAMYLDDNISKYAIELAQPNQPIEFKHVYQDSANQAHINSACCVSFRSWSPILQGSDLSDKDGAAEEDELTLNQDKIGSKVFYLQFSQVRQKFSDYQHLSLLLTHHRRMWGSDIFFQFMLMLHFNMVVLDPTHAMIERAPGHKHSALKTLKPAVAWLELTEEQFIPGDQRQVCLLIKEAVHRNLDRYEKKLAPLKRLDLKKVQAEKLKIPYETHQTFEEISLLPKLDGTVQRPNILQTQLLVATPGLSGAQIRDYQFEAIQKLVDCTGNIGYLQSPPRTGKTLMFWMYIALLTQNIRNWRGHILVVTPRKALVAQLISDAKTYKEKFPHIALILENIICMSSDESDVSCRLIEINERMQREPLIIVCCAKSLTQLLDSKKCNFLDQVAVSIVDEVHAVPSNLLNQLTTHAQEKHKTAIAISATVGEPAKDLYKRLIFEFTLLQAYEKGIICPFTVDAFNLKYSAESVATIIGQFPQFLQTTYHPNGKLFKDTKNIVFVPRIADAERLLQTLNSHSISAVVVHSKKNGQRNARDAALELFKDRAGVVNILILVEMLKVGITFACAESVIYLKNSQQNTDKAADNTYQAAARCLNNQSLSENASLPAQVRIAAIVLFVDANIKHLKLLMNDDYINSRCHANYTNQKRNQDDQPYRLVSFDTVLPRSNDMTIDRSSSNNSSTSVMPPRVESVFEIEETVVACGSVLSFPASAWASTSMNNEPTPVDLDRDELEEGEIKYIKPVSPVRVAATSQARFWIQPVAGASDSEREEAEVSTTDNTLPKNTVMQLDDELSEEFQWVI